MHLFLWLSSIPLYIGTTTSLSIHLSMVIDHTLDFSYLTQIPKCIFVSIALPRSLHLPFSYFVELIWKKKNPILFVCSSQYILCWQLSSFTRLERNTKCHAQNPQVYSVSGQFHYISLDNFHLSFYSMIFHTLLSLLGHSQPLSASISAVMLLFRENRNKKIRGSFYMLPSSTCTLASVPSSRTQLQLVTPSTAECEYLPKYRLIPIRQSYYNILH